MSMTMTILKTASLAGKAFNQSVTLTASGGDVRDDAAVPVAHAGTLTTRTSNTVGTLTMSSGGHGITTAARLDIYWSGGSRRGVVVGTVSGTSVPFTAGAGDNLPIATTAVTASVPTEIAWPFDGTAISALAFYTDVIGTFVLVDGSNTELLAKVLPATGAYIWFTGSGDTNPLSDTVAKLYLSHSDTAAAQLMRAGILI